MKTLIVDDSSFMREYLRHLIQKMGMVCEEASDGSQAIHLLHHLDDVELVLLDMNMPVMNGLDCLRAMRALGIAPHSKVMMVTTEADNEFIQCALEAGADEFLMKPFSAESLRDKLSLLGIFSPARRASEESQLLAVVAG